eukprot:6360339-Amphidinium_carterae.1
MAGMMGFMALVYALALTTAVANKSGKASKIMLMARAGLGALWCILALVVVIGAQDRGFMLAGVYVTLGLLAVPEV